MLLLLREFLSVLASCFNSSSAIGAAAAIAAAAICKNYHPRHNETSKLLEWILDFREIKWHLKSTNC
jgi:hypothetical protein